MIPHVIPLTCLLAASGVLLWLTYMDMRYFLLPDRGNAALAALGLIYQAATLDWANGQAVQSAVFLALTGAACGALIFLFTRWVSLKWKGVEGIGWGDVKFAAAAGLWLGPGGVGLMIGFAAGILLLVGLSVVALTRRPLQNFYLPFGAAAAPATLLMLWANYGGWFVF